MPKISSTMITVLTFAENPGDIYYEGSGKKERKVSWRFKTSLLLD